MLSIFPIVGGLFGKDCAIFNATTPAQTYFSISKERYPNQINIRLNSEVEKILFDKGKVKGVMMKGGEEIFADKVLLTAGAWSRQVLDHSNVPEHLSIPVVPVKRVLYVILPPLNGNKSVSYTHLTLPTN